MLPDTPETFPETIQLKIILEMQYPGIKVLNLKKRSEEYQAHYPFTAPAATPLMMYFCRLR